MRAFVALLASPLLVFTAGCYGPPDHEPVAPPAPRATYTGPASASIGSADATVSLRLDRFGMRVENAAGKVLLDTFDDDSMVLGDDAHAYGALGATYHDTFITVGFRPVARRISVAPERVRCVRSVAISIISERSVERCIHASGFDSRYRSGRRVPSILRRGRREGSRTARSMRSPVLQAALVTDGLVSVL